MIIFCTHILRRPVQFLLDGEFLKRSRLQDSTFNQVKRLLWKDAVDGGAGGAPGSGPRAVSNDAVDVASSDSDAVCIDIDSHRPVLSYRGAMVINLTVDDMSRDCWLVPAMKMLM